MNGYMDNWAGHLEATFGRTREEPEEVEEHEEDDTNTYLHAHVSTAANDCDGPLYQDYVSALNDEERAEHEQAQGVNDFHDLHFKARILSNHVRFHTEFGATVKVTAEGFEVHEQTDEGYRAAEVRWCEDPDCDPHAASQRDVFAEMMGY